MTTFKERYVVDEKGNRVGLLLDLQNYRQLIEELEEMESIRAYDTARACRDQSTLLEEAVAEIESAH
ncbi:MAG: hypothetical protein ABIK79_12705 [Chloroflexota bacterium]|nr:hypothetical protein [Anaerolineae bacterium]